MTFFFYYYYYSNFAVEQPHRNLVHIAFMQLGFIQKLEKTNHFKQYDHQRCQQQWIRS